MATTVRRQPDNTGIAVASPIVPALDGPVLVVDDEAECLSLARRVIEREGHQVICSDRPDAVPALVGTVRPRLILLDILMPEFDGWDVLAALRAEPATRLVTVVMTSVLDEAVRARRNGAAAFVLKPLDRDKVLSLLGGTIQAAE